MGRRPAATALALALIGASGCGSSSEPTGPSGPPVVTYVNGATLPVAPIGATVVISGSSFGASQSVGSGEVLFSNGAGGTVTATIASAGDWTDNLIVTSVPAGAAAGDLIVRTSKGSSAAVVFTVATSVAFSPSTVSWTATTALPVGLSGHALAAATLSPGTSVVYVVGGADSTNAPRSTVYYATAGATGAVGAWASSTALPAAVAFAAAVVATPANSPVTAGSYLYVLGGASAAGGTPVSTVYVGTLGAGGGVNGWTTTTALPTPVHSPGAVIFNGNLYVAGGSGTGNAPVATVYRAAIQPSGALGAWQALPALPFARSYFAFGLNGAFLYALGGDSGAVTPNDSSLRASRIADVVYAQIDVRTGNLTSAGWVAGANKLVKAVAKHTAVVAYGNVLVTAGLYSGSTTGSTEESYASLNVDGTTSSFGGATGSNTIASAGGGDVFNHAATGYLDAAGGFHVLVVGGDDVNAPTKKRKGVFYY
jgi:hypothetical protein